MKAGQAHILFGNFRKEALLNIKNFPIEPESLICLYDDLSIGPIAKLDQTNGIFERAKWIEKSMPCLEETSFSYDRVQKDFEQIQSLKTRIDQYDKIYIWFGKTNRERLYKARLISELGRWYQKLILLDIPDIKIQSKSGHDYEPVSINIMHPDDIHLITKYFRAISIEECKVWKELWQVLENEDGLLRLPQADGTIKTTEVSVIDQALMENCKDDFQNSARVVGYTLVALDFEVGDHTLNWRLIELAKNNVLDHKGELNCLRQYEVKKRRD
jgi:hypothetical protein